ncbi:hypothetical protein ACJQWK_04965 [Exserohilum turcicum]|uniref:Uncharacterized protein n=1 Tax=Exserohilum turcicum (strain 28A) TaxID=671987 RepID=R0IBD6_EXST2|nr:uncharacterized protein SETTUDRAFT_34131 [Exserohilum turcica Et28A]EOA82571.1 hypothetical protein SETTUDRAFT_34131 [Exserohilum turcica Et28A]
MFGVPTGPVAMEGRGGPAFQPRPFLHGPHVPIWRGGQAGRHTPAHAGRGGSGGQPPATTNPPVTAPVAAPASDLDPAKFKPPQGSYRDQSTLDGRGSMRKYSKCLRCGKFKGVGHPKFVDCREKCDVCDSNAHPGEVCTQIWASKRWWKDHHGYAPENVQLRPTPPQRAILAEKDPWFRDHPEPVEDMQEDEEPLLSRKRGADDGLDEEIRQRMHEVEVQVYSERLGQADKLQAQYKAQVLQAQREVLDTQQLVSDAEEFGKRAVREKREAEKTVESLRAASMRKDELLAQIQEDAAQKRRDYKAEVEELRRENEMLKAELAIARGKTLSGEIKQEHVIDDGSSSTYIKIEE